MRNKTAVNILSWNIQWGRGADGEVRLSRIIDTVRGMGAVEVICLQEVAQGVEGLKGGAVGDQVARLAEAFPQHRAFFGAAVDRLREDGGRARFGNLVLSSLPVDQVFHHLLPCPADPGVPGMPRACTEVVVLADSGPLRVLTTHLEYYSPRQREAQVAALRALQLEVADNLLHPANGKEDNPVFAPRPRPLEAVVCGDFNCEPDSPAYRLMGEAMTVPQARWRDAWRVLHDEPHPATVGLNGAEWPDRPYCCDYFWVSEALRPRVRALSCNPHTAASDHQPLLLTLG